MADDPVIDESMMLDPSLKKKKKKKKPIDLDDGDAAVPETTEAAPAPAPADAADDIDNLDDLMTKKKKKKKKVADDDDALPAGGDEREVPGADMDAELSLLPKKKKKKKVELDDEEDAEVPMPADDDAGEELEDDDGEDLVLTSKKKKKGRAHINLDEESDEDDFIDMSGQTKVTEAWIGTDRDYTYQELLERAFRIMREKNPDHEAGEKRRFVMKPPQIVRIGTKKCAFVNFTEICKLLHRQPDHLLAYILAELGTSGSVDGNNQLVIRGRFQQKNMEQVLRHYIREYVTCKTCKSPDTMLSKENRLFFLHCETCGSKASVAAIKAGYQAVTTKRAAVRTG